MIRDIAFYIKLDHGRVLRACYIQFFIFYFSLGFKCLNA